MGTLTLINNLSFKAEVVLPEVPCEEPMEVGAAESVEDERTSAKVAKGIVTGQKLLILNLRTICVDISDFVPYFIVAHTLTHKFYL